jgi:hypothetical protein
MLNNVAFTIADIDTELDTITLWLPRAIYLNTSFRISLSVQCEPSIHMTQ